MHKVFALKIGQARKSLWIETEQRIRNDTMRRGQARKSLWIETETSRPVRWNRVGSGS